MSGGMGCTRNDHHSQARIEGVIEHEPLYVDRRGDEDLTCAGAIVMAMLCLMLAFVYIITGAA